MSKKKLVEGGCLFNFVQLKSGKWAGQGLHGVCVSEVFPLGQHPDRFKYELFTQANKAESAEYWKYSSVFTNEVQFYKLESL